jgi:hypothetical protein
MNTRTRLHNRRFSETFNFESMNLKFTTTVSRFADGSVAEAFLDNGKTSAIGILARDLGVVFSIAVQCGADADVIRRALSRDPTGQAQGPLGAALDLLMREPP